MAHPRVDNFIGTTEEYCHYLENIVLQLRHDATPSPIPQASKPSSNLSIHFANSQPIEPSGRSKRTLKLVEEWWPSFLEGVPGNEKEWKEKRESMNLSTPEELISAICLLLQLPSQPLLLECSGRPMDPVDQRMRPGCLEILDNYSSFAIHLSAHARLAKQMSNYAVLLFICLAVIARKAGDPVAVVDKKVQGFLSTQQGSCNAGARVMRRIRKSAVWAIQRMEYLYNKGLKHRAWEIFLFYGPSIHSYCRCMDQCKMDEPAKKVPVIEPPAGEFQADVPFHITFLCKVILGERCSLDFINQVLGTKLSKNTFNAWGSTLYKRIESVRGIERPLQSSKRQKVSHKYLEAGESAELITSHLTTDISGTQGSVHCNDSMSGGNDRAVGVSQTRQSFEVDFPTAMLQTTPSHLPRRRNSQADLNSHLRKEPATDGQWPSVSTSHIADHIDTSHDSPKFTYVGLVTDCLDEQTLKAMGLS